MRPLPSPAWVTASGETSRSTTGSRYSPRASGSKAPPPGDADEPAGPGDPAAPLGATDGSGEADAGASDGGDGDDVACVPPHAASTTSRTAMRPAATG